ncbi:hypothetical protein SNEBB_000863 [Seison nebaliae]|nr:hypothetical protein SNEBB_000863 [Seison nebaliae]
MLMLMKGKVQFEGIPIRLGKREHLTDSFKRINPLQRVPVLEFENETGKRETLIESCVIGHYLGKNYVNDWYPIENKEKQRQIDSILHWQHLNIRLGGSYIFRSVAMGGKNESLNKQNVQLGKIVLHRAFDDMKNYFLKNNLYMLNDKFTIGDLFVMMELEQPLSVGYELTDKKISEWYERCKGNIDEKDYEDVLVFKGKLLNKFRDRYLQLERK